MIRLSCHFFNTVSLPSPVHMAYENCVTPFAHIPNYLLTSDRNSCTSSSQPLVNQIKDLTL